MPNLTLIGCGQGQRVQVLQTQEAEVGRVLQVVMTDLDRVEPAVDEVTRGRPGAGAELLLHGLHVAVHQGRVPPRVLRKRQRLHLLFNKILL